MRSSTAGAAALALAPLFGLLSWSAPAKAEPPPATEEGDEAPPLVPMADDLVSGHVQLGAGGGIAFPFGLLSDGVRHGRRGGTGFAATGDLTVGLDRFVRVGGYFDLNLAGDSSRCDDCTALGYSAGALVKYHFVQGLRIDPWVSYGIGYRALSGDRAGEDFSYAGLEWMRLQVGADWYAARFFGLSPYGQFDAATMLDRPDGEDSGSPDLRFSFGVRLLFDFPGR